jgi:hypothetical protein
MWTPKKSPQMDPPLAPHPNADPNPNECMNERNRKTDLHKDGRRRVIVWGFALHSENIFFGSRKLCKSWHFQKVCILLIFPFRVV